MFTTFRVMSTRALVAKVWAENFSTVEESPSSRVGTWRTLATSKTFLLIEAASEQALKIGFLVWFSRMEIEKTDEPFTWGV